MKDTINVYLTKQERKMIDDLKAKYQLSLTTITDILCFQTYHAMLLEENKNQSKKGLRHTLTETYMHERGGKTSIKKPKILKQNSLFGNFRKKDRFATNVIKIYLYKEIDKYITDKEIIQKEYWNAINNKFTTTRDEFWNYNNFVRNMRRGLKENKDYFKEEISKIENGK